MSKLRICLVSSEVAPFSKTGGLADVSAGLSRWLARRGHDVRIFTPLYERVARAGYPLETETRVGDVSVPFGDWSQEFAIRSTPLPDGGGNGGVVPVHLIDCPGLYGRERLYSSEHGDEALRFALLSRAVLEACQRLDWFPHVFHCNDWHTAMLPVYKRTLYDWDRKLWASRTLLTIHNIDFQGVFPSSRIGDLGMRGLERHLHQGDWARGEINCMKSGLAWVDWISTVSDTYAHEIQTAEGGRGLDGILRDRSGSLSGIVNGCDYGDWDPATDPHIPSNYTRDDRSGKLECKKRLLERMLLPYSADCVVFGMVSRLTHQKGVDLLPQVLPAFLREYPQARVVVLGSGEARYEDALQWLRNTFPTQIAIFRGYHEELAHWIEAGSDVFLMPSLFEPCGLNQMYSMRYGTIPVVRRTGGLADTVRPWNPVEETGTGFVFWDFDPFALLAEMRHAMGAHAHPPAWDTLVENAMREDWSWDRQGVHYENLYRHIASR
ncbi:MAG: glycogen synthase [Planctomycetes bacterium]|nr:glycogen synthase [Planctomycetota bacterium]